MEDESKKRKQLIKELAALRQRIAELDTSTIECKQMHEELNEYSHFFEGTVPECTTRFAHAELDQIFDSAAVGMRVIDKDFNLLRINETFSEMFDICKDEAVGGKCYDVCPGPWCHTENCTLTRIVAGEERIECDIEKVRSDGECVPYFMVATPFRDSDAGLTGAVASFVDITDRKRAEEELRRSREELEVRVKERTAELAGANDALLHEIAERKRAEEKLRELYQQEMHLRQQLEAEITRRVEFTRTLTHELKTPLTSVLASAEVLVSELREEPLLSLAKNINRSALDLNSRINELFDLAKGEIGMLELRPEPVNVLQLLREIIENMTPVTSIEGQHLIADLPTSLPLVQADADRVRQIVTNLLGNAHKFTPRNGRITIRVREHNDTLVIEVQDTGHGMSEEEQRRLFEPYYRIQGDTERFSGLGLGLSLCKTLVELHGGQIWVRSRPSKGATFGFSLPLESNNQQEPAPEKAGKLWKVLIIEDNQQIVDSISLTFRIRWPEAHLISTRLGGHGIEIVESEVPDIVILDLGLPDINGFTVLRQIRLFSSVPIVVLTVKAEESNIVKALEWGADDYIVKPFRQLELLARLKVQLRKQTPLGEDCPIICGPMRFDPSTSQLNYGEREISLTVIEGHIIKFLMTNAGHVATYSRIAEAVWGDDYPGVLDSLRVYIRRLREKLEEDPGKPELILTKPGIGYLLTKPI